MKFIIATGGTGGHIFPALNVATELKREGHNVHFIGVFGDYKERIGKKGFEMDEIEAKGFSVEKFWPAVLGMLKSLKMSFRLLRQYKPDGVVGFGGYASFPVVMAAFFLRIPTLIHEQNVMPGKANIVLSKFVNRIALSFEKSQKFFNSKKTIVTGYPCHINMKQINRTEVLSKFGLKQDYFTIIVFGGSLGSHRINLEFSNAVDLLQEKYSIQAIHCSGKIDYPFLSEEYKKKKIPYCLFEFLDGIESAYKVADLVISRAGAATISELARFKVPAILIPYPYAHEHQKENALVLQEAKVAYMLEEKDLSAQKLSEAIVQFFENSPSTPEIEKRLKGIFYPDAMERLVKETLALAK